MRVITYDVEIATPVGQGEKLTWDDAKDGKAGIASVALYDTQTGRYHVYMPDVYFSREDFCFKVSTYEPLYQMVHHMNQADLLVGFNNVEFDKKVIENTLHMQLEPKQYDILDQVWHAIGQRHKGYGLGPICNRTLGLGKSGTGEHAPKLFAEGRFGELIDYNINDVHLTRTLFNHIADTGYVLDLHNEKLPIAKALNARA